MIHQTAIVHPGAKLHESVEVGPYSIIGEKVCLGANVKVYSHVCIDGNTVIGEGTQIFPFSVIGFIPPDLKYQGEDARLVVGKNNVFREHVTIHIGTAADRMETTIGDNVLLMANAHVAHDCVLEDGVIMANCAALGGHVHVEKGAIIGGLAAIQQRVRIGAYAIIGGMSGIDGDIIPYGSASGERANLTGINIIGLKRKGIENELVLGLSKAYKEIFEVDSNVMEERIEKAKAHYANNPYVMEVVDFIQNKGKKLCLPSSVRKSNGE